MENDLELEIVQDEIEVEAKEEESKRSLELEETANNFSSKLYTLVKEFEDKLPIVYILKIIHSIDVDLYAALLGTNMEYFAKSLRKEFSEVKSTEYPGKSSIVVG